MIPREWTEPAIAAGVAEWHRGRQSDPALAPGGVPDLSVLPGYSLDDVSHNCVGLLSPGQARQATTSWLGQLACLGGLGAFMSLVLAAWWGPLVFIALIFIGFVGRKAVIDFREIRAGQLSQVDGDIWTERRWDSESEQFFVHIDDLRLEITRQAYAVLRDGGPYRIYYLPHAKRAVGGQVLPAWRPLLEPRSEAAQSVKPNQHRADGSSVPTAYFARIAGVSTSGRARNSRSDTSPNSRTAHRRAAQATRPRHTRGW
jgi:hypothetical protein